MNPKVPLISIVCPAFQEEEVLPLFHRELMKVLESLKADYEFEIIYVDDGSKDQTRSILAEMVQSDKRVGFLSFTRNQGHQTALLAGLEHSMGHAVISLDSDLQHPPELINELLWHWRDGNQLVQTVRTSNRSAGWFKESTSRAFYKILGLACQAKVPEGAADFRLLDRAGVDAILAHKETGLFLRGLIPSLCLKTAFVPYEAAPRAAGQSKYTFGKMVHLAVDAFFQVGFAPARLAWPLAAAGLVFFAMVILVGAYRGLTGAQAMELAIWALGAVVTASSAMLMVMLGIVGEYAARILEQNRNRPPYLLKESRLPEYKSQPNWTNRVA